MPQESRYRVLVTDVVWPNVNIEREVVGQVGAELVVAKTGDEHELRAYAPQMDAILTCFRRVSAETIQAAERCLIISRYGVGLDNIDVKKATELGIVVTNVPDYCVDEVSDHALALLMCSARRVMVYDRSARAGAWDSTVAMPIPRLRGLNLGVIGFGRIGRAVARKAQAFGLHILAHDPLVKPEDVAKEGATSVDLDMLLHESDFVTVHVPLIPATEKLLNAKTFRKMKPTAWIINTARGGIVDTGALYEALKAGVIGGAALDVLPQEPPQADEPLRTLSNVILTPHVAFYSEGSLAELETKAAEHVAQALRGEVPTNIVNPQALEQANCRIKPR